MKYLNSSTWPSTMAVRQVSKLERGCLRLLSTQSGRPVAASLTAGKERVFVVGVGMTKFLKVAELFVKDS